MNPYHQFVADYAKLLAAGKNYPLGGFPVPERKPPAAPTQTALIFSPHPDDEVIIGGLPLRLLRELNMNVMNVAVTQGSNKARQAERWKELKACCDYIGFGLIQTGENGLEGINLKAREAQPEQWKASVARIAQILQARKPAVIFFPHVRDWNSSHIGTHHLVMEALQGLARGFSCYAVETEFWGAMDAPNLMVETSPADLADLITALSFHVGEVKRNPYHLRLPAWMIDNVRRGGELVGGQGGEAPDFTFATLYRLSYWDGNSLKPVFEKGLFVGKNQQLGQLFFQRG